MGRGAGGDWMAVTASTPVVDQQDTDVQTGRRGRLDEAADGGAQSAVDDRRVLHRQGQDPHSPSPPWRAPESQGPGTEVAEHHPPAGAVGLHGAVTRAGTP